MITICCAGAGVGAEKEEGVATNTDAEAESGGTTPLLWLVRRMSQMAVRKGDDRRVAVFKWFATVAATQEASVVEGRLVHSWVHVRMNGCMWVLVRGDGCWSE